MKPRNNHPTRIRGRAWGFPAFVLLIFVSMAFLPSANRPAAEKEMQTAFSLVCLERAAIEFNVTEPGTIYADAEWTPQEQPGVLILYGPGQMNYYLRQDGKSPQKIEFNVTERHVARGSEWSIIVLNQNDERILGILKVKFPGEEPKSF